MKNIDADKLIKFKEALADIIVSSQGICTYQDCKDIAEREALLLIATLQQEQPEVELEKVVEFYCISKKVKMTIQELINYYIDTECAETADECGF